MVKALRSRFTYARKTERPLKLEMGSGRTILVEVVVYGGILGAERTTRKKAGSFHVA